MAISLARALSKLRLPIPVSMGGTAGTTQASARTGLGLGSAAIVDVVGLMANNAIIESGSNTLGAWTKLADGTMICSHRLAQTLTISLAFGQTYYASGASMTFPVAFIAAPYMSLSCSITGGGGWVGRGQSQTTANTGPFIVLSSIARSSESITIEYIAIGRWKP